jgi:hypothetical protein
MTVNTASGFFWGERGEIMKRKRYSLIVVLALIAGFLGGMVSSQMPMIKTAFAGKTDLAKKVVKAERFELVDAKGNMYAELKVSERGPQLRMLDGKGSAIDLFIDHPGGEPRAGLFLISPKSHSIKLETTDSGTHMVFTDEKGGIIWSKP